MSNDKDPVSALLDLILSNRLNVLQKCGTVTNCYNTQFTSYGWTFPEISEDDTKFQLNIFTSSSQQRILIESWEFEIKNRERLEEVNATNILFFRSILSVTRALPAYLYSKLINSKPNNYQISYILSLDESPNPKLLSNVETSEYTFNLGDVEKYITLKVHYVAELSQFSEPTTITDGVSLLQSYWGADNKFKSCIDDQFTSCVGSAEFKSCIGDNSVPVIEILPISKLNLSDDTVFLSCISHSDSSNNLSSNDSIIDIPINEPPRPAAPREPSPLELLFTPGIQNLRVFAHNIDYRRQFREGKAFIQEFSHKDVFAGNKINQPQNHERRTVQRRI